MTGNERTWTAYGSLLDKDTIWYVNYRGVLLCAYSLAERKMKKVEVIPYSGRRSQLLYSNVLKAGDTLILVPANALDMCLYDMETERFEKVPLHVPVDSSNLFCGGIVWKGHVYLIPYEYPYIVKVNLSTKRAEKVCRVQESVSAEPGEAAFQYNYVQNGQRVFFLSALENKIFCFDMDTESVEAKEVGETGAVLSALSLTGDGGLAAIDQQGSIYIISEDLANWEVYDAGIKTDSPLKSYADAICADGSVFFFPAHADTLLEYRSDQKRVSRIEFEDNERNDYKESMWSGGIKFSLLHEWKGLFCGFYTETGKLFMFDPKDKKMTFYEADSYLGGDEAERIMERIMEQGVVAESNHAYDSLDTFLRVIRKY